MVLVVEPAPPPKMVVFCATAGGRVVLAAAEDEVSSGAELGVWMSTVPGSPDAAGGM